MNVYSNNKREPQDDEAQLAQGEEDDSDQVLLMVITETEDTSVSHWYLDTGCSTHMTGHKD